MVSLVLSEDEGFLLCTCAELVEVSRQKSEKKIKINEEDTFKYAGLEISGSYNYADFRSAVISIFSYVMVILLIAVERSSKDGNQDFNIPALATSPS